MREELDNRIGYNVHVLIGIHTARYCQAYRLKLRDVIFVGLRIAPCRNNASFHTAYARFNVELGSQRLCGELELIQMRTEAACIE